ncbi:hypothetical protein D9619_001670 [Psilocybe cf. subviscida]|uniref:DNA polymerase n=1 Tax=Psilocybe cf. subviscida TaxID=2480587 RepID=A0A8H5BDI0_9AGAR|nr:hypothetical protein D9619_001670 [Psilocybe cf. subviscida]
MVKRGVSNSGASNSSDTDSGSAALHTRSQKRLRPDSSGGHNSDDDSHPIKVHILHEKLDEDTINELHGLIENGSNHEPALEFCSKIGDSDVIVTAIRMRKRLERHIPWQVARTKAIVLPDWLRETAAQGKPVECGAYASLGALHKETVDNCPDCHDHANRSRSSTLAPDDEYASNDEGGGPTMTKPTDSGVFKDWTAKYACQRASPLVSVNQGLVNELNVIGRSRELEGEEVNALAYEKAAAILKSYPDRITQRNFHDVTKLKGIGKKTSSKIQEYIETGRISESREIRASERFKSLSAFAKIYSIGPTTARMLYSKGCRTVEDLERYYDVDPLGADGDPEPLLTQDTVLETPGGKKVSTVEYALGTGEEDSKKNASQAKPIDTTMTIRVALALRHDFEVPIPREEVEEMRRTVMRELHAIQPGCVSTITGGYRRGKEQSNDVDIVISHPDYVKGGEIIRGLCKKLVRNMHKSGLVTHVMHLSGFHAHNALRESHRDSLEKALTVFRFPENHKKYGQQNGRRVYRRLDLIFAEPHAYWTAVAGWTGSRLFERDLRLYAKMEKQMKFDSSGLTRRYNTSLLVPHSEEDLFNILGLPWIDPTMRNANA